MTRITLPRLNPSNSRRPSISWTVRRETRRTRITSLQVIVILIGNPPSNRQRPVTARSYANDTG